MTERRVDPTGKMALFSTANQAAPDQSGHRSRGDGRAALFSLPSRRPGTVVIECSECQTRSRVSMIDLGLRLATGSFWWPVRRYSRWMRCPACGRQRWCRIGWLE
jgi:hypothetical protein